MLKQGKLPLHSDENIVWDSSIMSKYAIYDVKLAFINGLTKEKYGIWGYELQIRIFIAHESNECATI